MRFRGRRRAIRWRRGRPGRRRRTGFGRGVEQDRIQGNVHFPGGLGDFFLMAVAADPERLRAVRARSWVGRRARADRGRRAGPGRGQTGSCRSPRIRRLPRPGRGESSRARPIECPRPPGRGRGHTPAAGPPAQRRSRPQRIGVGHRLVNRITIVQPGQVSPRTRTPGATGPSLPDTSPPAEVADGSPRPSRHTPGRKTSRAKTHASNERIIDRLHKDGADRPKPPTRPGRSRHRMRVSAIVVRYLAAILYNG